jgi:quercetin 2,3-dioxygenase
METQAMLYVRSSQDRGHANFGWLDSRHSFSFGSYHDPRFMGFSDLRVINQDVVEPGAGFGMHGHQDMEIITYVLRGAVAHEDSLGNREMVREGEIQRMTAGTGIRHSEFNPDPNNPVEFLQIWIMPDRKGLAPSYEQVSYRDQGSDGAFSLIGGPDGGPGAVTIHQDVRLYRGAIAAGQKAALPIPEGRLGWVQVISGELVLEDGQRVGPGDGLAIKDRAASRGDTKRS